MMKSRFVLFLGLTWFLSSSALAAPPAKPNVQEDFKGAPPAHELTFGALGGVGILRGEGGGAVIGTIAKKIVNQGFVPDINNQVFIEAQVGPVFAGPFNALFFSTHLRWDFPKDDLLTLYAIAGIAGDYADPKAAAVNGDVVIYPRFGAGVLYEIFPQFSLRGEVSHELTAIGISVAF